MISWYLGANIDAQKNSSSKLAASKMLAAPEPHLATS